MAALVTLILLLRSALAFQFKQSDTLSGSYARPGLPRNSSYYSSAALLTSLSRPPKGDCECFNCMLPKFSCGQFAECSEYDGQCKCPPGWSGQDCLIPQCGSLADGHERLPRLPGEECHCPEGWGGVNCNVCLSDNACTNFPLPNKPTGDDGGEVNMVCYKGGHAVREAHQMCKVTNAKILDELKGKIPHVTFSCKPEDTSCLFQFWVDQQESFYCGLDSCSMASPAAGRDSLRIECSKLKCKCVPGRMLCGEDGSVDISDFLVEKITGPAKFICGDSGCRFDEASMNELITDVFGDPYITLDCTSGECLAANQVPGYSVEHLAPQYPYFCFDDIPQRPPKKGNTLLVALSAAAGGAIFLLTFLGLWYVGRTGGDTNGNIRLPEAENAKLMADHIPASLQFTDVSYRLGSRAILDGITGHVKAGELLAIMGASGAGKSTFLDILARKNKLGSCTGKMTVNGHSVTDHDFRNVIGFVDQEDTLMSTLTVYETVLYSALLRLPREMSYEAKRFRTLETLQELGLLSVKDSRIGDSARRSISGGEKRRVSIACELVTSPSILFLDEPTSGLDAFNALSVVESLVALAKNYHRTVIFTIHQPRSNIVSLLDRLVVLAEGKTVYSGPSIECHEHFASIGRPCPVGFNIADFLIDITMESSDNNLKSPSNRSAQEVESSSNSSEQPADSTELQPRGPVTTDSNSTSLRHRTSQLFDALSGKLSNGSNPRPISSTVQALHEAYIKSDVAASVKEGISQVELSGSERPGGEHLEPSVIRGHRRASWLTQFQILSGRAFKNMYRDPALLTAHYVSAIAVGLICGLFYRDVGDDIGGFQNRLGFFFFTLSLFGFSCLSSLGLFANERVLFIRERSNGYYSTLTYFASKVLFDIMPLRVVPPFVYGGITYGLIGLVPQVATFWKFMLTLVLFNLTTASVVLTLSVAFASTSVSTLIGTLIMLFNLLFAGLLINVDSIVAPLRWLPKVAFFHAGFEALAVNELRYLHLHEVKYGVEIDVPSAVILQTFGLKALAFWWPDMATLVIVFASFTVLSYLLLRFYVTERR